MVRRKQRWTRRRFLTAGSLAALSTLAGCGDRNPVAVVPLAATVLPDSGDAKVVLFVPGAS